MDVTETIKKIVKNSIFEKCYYCGAPVYKKDDFQRFQKEFKICGWIGKRLQQTVEHKLEKKNGGGWEADNLETACIWCNQKRDQFDQIGVHMTAGEYKKFVQKMMKMEIWHPPCIIKMIKK